VTMPKCHFCGKSGPYTEMIDHIVYSVHPKCGFKLFITSFNVKEFRECFVCEKINETSKEELKNHLVNDHTKDALADFIINTIY
jgi:hypothetical protein